MSDTKNPEDAVPETGPFIGLVNTPKGWLVRGVWLKHKTVTKAKVYFGPSPSRLEADDALKIAVVEEVLNG